MKHYDIKPKISVVVSIFMAFTIYFSSCSDKGANSASDSAGWESDTGIPDSVMPDTIKPQEEDADATPPSLNLHTTEEILSYMESSPHYDRYSRGILPQMARDVPEYASKLLDNQYDGFLIVDKNTMRLYRYDRYGVEIERVGIACAKPYGSKHARRDNRTPEGFFTIEGIYNSTDWLYTDDDGNTSKVKGQFGPRFMRLRTPVSSQIGIHGTVAPWSIGGRRSHGCIRMTNENILRFAEICSAGWPVIVSPGPRDMQVNKKEGYDIPSVAVIPGVARCKPGSKAEDPVKKVSEETADTIALPHPDDNELPSTPENEIDNQNRNDSVM